MERAQGYSYLENQIELLAKESEARATEKNQDGIYGMSAAMSELAQTIGSEALTTKTREYLGNQIELLAEMSKENHTSAEKLLKYSDAMCALANALFAR